MNASRLAIAEPQARLEGWSIRSAWYCTHWPNLTVVLVPPPAAAALLHGWHRSLLPEVLCQQHLCCGPGPESEDLQDRLQHPRPLLERCLQRGGESRVPLQGCLLHMQSALREAQSGRSSLQHPSPPPPPPPTPHPTHTKTTTTTATTTFCRAVPSDWGDRSGQGVLGVRWPLPRDLRLQKFCQVSAQLIAYCAMPAVED